MREPAPKLHEQWDGRNRPERWALLESVGESITWCEVRYWKLPARVRKAIEPELRRGLAEVLEDQ